MPLIKNDDIRPVYPPAFGGGFRGLVPVAGGAVGPELDCCVCQVGWVGQGENCPIYLNTGYVIAIPVLYADFARKEIRENLPPIIAQLIHSLQCLSEVIGGPNTKRPKPPQCGNNGGCQSLLSRPGRLTLQTLVFAQRSGSSTRKNWKGLESQSAMPGGESGGRERGGRRQNWTCRSTWRK